MMPQSLNENRRTPRVSHKTRVYFKPGRKSNQKGVVRDVSETGVFLVTYDKLYEGLDLILYIPVDILGRESLCVLLGNVVRVEKRPGAEACGYGVQFKALSPGAKALLQRFVRTKLRGKDHPQN